jgi:[Skp1-protein]-hydroxyproline N-acetylglucosaminyltransferase
MQRVRKKKVSVDPSSTPSKRGSRTRKSRRSKRGVSAYFAFASYCLWVLFFLALTRYVVYRSSSTPAVESSKDTKKSNGLKKSSSITRIDASLKKKEQPVLPIDPPTSAEKLYHSIPNAERLMADTMYGMPSIAGIVAVIQKFLSSMHKAQKELSSRGANVPEIIDTFFDMTSKHLAPLESAYRGMSIFDVRDDDSIFISIAAYREHLLDQTLRFAFDKAAHPEKLFVGAVVQNCFGLGGGDKPCRTGVQVVGKRKDGSPLTKVSDAPPDVNGIDTFCKNPNYKKYCDANQIRVLYVDENEALGPAMARYFASKLWGGESFFMQVDAHLEFAKEWDKKYVEEVKATKNYPKSVLSAYPPGFGAKVDNGSPGAKLCTCEFSKSDVENEIIRINTGSNYHGHPDHPHQIPFIAAGFFFARGEFLVDVPFDPYLPWCFMGEEIALSMRAWTSGWNIYAPRVNLITHQYRPGRMGLPKFWESVQRTWRQPSMNTMIQKQLIQRIKNIVLYSDVTVESIESNGNGIVLRDAEHYGLGKARKGTEYLEFANIDMEAKQCKYMKWCSSGELD